MSRRLEIMVRTTDPGKPAFESELQRLRVELKDSQSRLLFRGQTDSENRLTTTLERKSSKGMSFRDYYFLAVGLIKPAVETFTGVNWDVQEHLGTRLQSIRKERFTSTVKSARA